MTKQKTQIYDEVMSRIILELDTEYTDYQQLYIKLYGKYDSEAKLLHTVRINLCKRIIQELLNEQRK
jgi:hypothetical protein